MNKHEPSYLLHRIQHQTLKCKEVYGKTYRDPKLSIGSPGYHFKEIAQPRPSFMHHL
jgi:hypothetical protein